MAKVVSRIGTPERDEGDEEHLGDGALVRTGERERGDGEADEIRAAVAEVDFRRRKIEDEKAEQRARHGEGVAGHGDLLIVQRHDAERDRHAEAEPAGEAVEAVDQVDDIRHGDEPEDGHRQAPAAEFDAAHGARDRRISRCSDPRRKTRQAVASWPRSFFRAPSGLRSSHRPSPYISTLPTRMGNQLRRVRRVGRRR